MGRLRDLDFWTFTKGGYVVGPFSPFAGEGRLGRSGLQLISQGPSRKCFQIELQGKVGVFDSDTFRSPNFPKISS